MLPVVGYLPEIVAALRAARSLILVAEPGAGKTTLVPAALLADRPAEVIWVLQPRRLAARLAAQQVARLRGEAVGGTVGYRVRFEAAESRATRLLFVTEGMLWRALARDPTLAGVAGVIFDEFHGRTLACDVGLAALRHLQQAARRDLWLLVMSATLDVAAVQGTLPDAAVLRVPGRQHPVAVDYLPQRDARPLAVQVARAVAAVRARQPMGDLLVFLPGRGEIAACRQALAGRPEAVVPLHGGMDPAAQDRAVAPSPTPRLVLATNVAETSVTLPQITAVVDSGLAREADVDPWSGMPRLRLVPVSQAAGAQRAGRAGRTGPGYCLRLATQADWQRRPAHTLPEIARLDLAEAVLLLAHAGLPQLDVLPCVDPPPPAALAAADRLLRELGALEGPAEAPRITATGRALAALPLHPRLGRLLLEAGRLGIGELGATAAALLAGPAAPADLPGAGEDDLARRCAVPLTGELRQVRRGLARLDVAGAASPSHEDAARGRAARASSAPDRDAALGRAALAAFPDRVGRCVLAAGGTRELLMCAGGRARIAPSCAGLPGAYVVALGARSRDAAGKAMVQVDLVQQIAADDLLVGSPAWLVADDALVWDAARGRVEQVEQIRYGRLVLLESRAPARDVTRAAPLVIAAVAAAGWDGLLTPADLLQLRGRLEVVAQANADLTVPELAVGPPPALLEALCAGCASLAEVRERVGGGAAVVAALGPEIRAALAADAPMAVAVPPARTLAVHYAPGQPPHVEAPLQAFFGLGGLPPLGRGRVGLVAHLLAPNRRPVQVTQDLARFWSVHYPALRGALSRRYPRHAWPDDPAHAEPPAARRR